MAQGAASPMRLARTSFGSVGLSTPLDARRSTVDCYDLSVVDSPAAHIVSMLPRLLVSSPSPFLASAAGRWSRFWQTSAAFLPQTILRPAALSLTIPGLIADIWDSVLRAVPKKKVSHMKRRHRQMAGKALKDVKSLSTCPACGQFKRAHVLCSHCVSGVYSWTRPEGFIWRNGR